MPAVALIMLGPCAVASAAELPLGFVSHFPMVRHEDDSLPETGASVVIVRAPWPFLEPTEGQFQFELLDEQLAWADRVGLQLVYILEAGPAHAAGVPWLVEKLQAQGETMVQENGTPARDPSPFSPTYRQYLSRYINRTVGYLRRHKLSHVVYGYNNGCEWWLPLSNSYGPLAAEAFREGLRHRYGDLRALNDRWGTQFAVWEQVEPPRLSLAGMGTSPQGTFVPASATLDVGYCTTEEAHLPVRPGQRLVFEVECETDARLGGAARAEIAWLRAAGPPALPAGESPLIAINQSAPVCGRGRHATLRVEAAAPEGASRAWLHLKAVGVGKVTFRRAVCTDETGRQLLGNPGLDPALGGWQFIPWTAGERERLTQAWPALGDAWVSYRPSGKLGSGAAHPLAEVYDWFEFRATAVAQFLDWFAAEVKAADPSRPVITYLTFAFASPFEWDYAQEMGIYVDRVAQHAEHEDVLGLQLAATAGDYDSVTCAFDLARKYGQPMWAIELLDFSRGVALGQDGLTRISRAVLQHGGTGIQYYCWWGTPVYNYGELGVPALRDLIGAVRSTANDLGKARPECPVALVMPRMPLYAYLPEPHNDWADFMGWYKLLVRLGVYPDVYTLEELGEAHLSRYGAVVAPDCAYLPGSALEALSRLDHRRTRLISSGRFARRDMSARRIAADRRPGADTALAQPVGALVLGETFRHPSPTDTPPRLRCVADELQLQRPEVAQMVQALRGAGVPLLLEPGEAPVTAVAFRRGGERLAFVVPEREWAGTVRVLGQACEVPPTGAVCRLGGEP